MSRQSKSRDPSHSEEAALPTRHEERVVRMPEVKRITQLSEPTIWRGVKDRTFPAPIQLGKRARGWLYSDIMGYLRGLPRLDTAA